MKKLLMTFLFAAVLGITGTVYASERGVPRSVGGDTIQNADMVGVRYATSAFSSALSTVTFSSMTALGDFTVYGIVWSTGLCGDFVDIWDSTSAANVLASMNTTPTYRNYNVTGSTTGVGGGASSVLGGQCGGPNLLMWPIHFSQGLFWRVSTSLYNSATLLYRKDGDD